MPKLEKQLSISHRKESFADNQNEQELEVSLQLWDTPGQEQFRAVVKNYYRNVQGVVLVFSLEKAPQKEQISQQLKSMEYWLE